MNRFRIPALAAEPATHQDPWLHARLHEKTATFNGHIRSVAHFQGVQERYADFVRHPIDNCVPPAQDLTMPTTDAEMVRYIHRLFDAVIDFSSVDDKSAPVTRGTGQRELSWSELTASQRVKVVVRTELSDIELEMLCWNVLVSFCLLSGGLSGCEGELTGVVGHYQGATG